MSDLNGLEISGRVARPGDPDWDPARAAWNLAADQNPEAVAFAETVYHGRPTTFDHDMVPTAVFCQPPVGTVGYSEAEARRRFGKIDIYLTRFRPM